MGVQLLVEILQLAIEVKYGGYIYIENLWEKMMLELQCLGKDHIFFITMEAWKFEDQVQTRTSSCTTWNHLHA